MRRLDSTACGTPKISRSAAEVYESNFVPRLFRDLAGKVATAAGIQRGDKVLDVACGTGVLSREAASRGATVAGLDASAAMLGVASRLAPAIAWNCGLAEALPFREDEFDVAVNQMGLMYVADMDTAIREMLRVVRPGGRVAVALLDASDSDGFRDLVALVRGLFGDELANTLPAPFLVGPPTQIKSRFAACGAADIVIKSSPGSAIFASLYEWLFTEIRGWTLAESLTDEQFETLVREGTTALAQYVSGDGRVTFDSPTEIVTATKPADWRTER